MGRIWQQQNLTDKVPYFSLFFSSLSSPLFPTPPFLSPPLFSSLFLSFTLLLSSLPLLSFSFSPFPSLPFFYLPLSRRMSDLSTSRDVRRECKSQAHSPFSPQSIRAGCVKMQPASGIVALLLDPWGKWWVLHLLLNVVILSWGGASPLEDT